MNGSCKVYDFPDTPSLHCTVKGRVAIPGVVMELHHYRFRGRQRAVFSSRQSFLDLALSPRPGRAMGGFAGNGVSRALGDILFVPAGRRLHSHWGEGEQTSICFGFDEAAFGELDEEALLSALDVRSPVLHDALRRIAAEIVRPGFRSEMLIEAIWLQSTIELQRYLRRPTQHDDAAKGGLSALQLRQVFDLIEQPGKPPTVGELAHACGLSSRHFFRQFKVSTGHTLSSYVAERKMELAKQRLRQPRAPIKVIAWECGFESAAAFSAAFRRTVGVTPRQFREDG